MATTYLTRTPASTTNQRTFTFSAWVKRSNIGADMQIFGQQATSYFRIMFRSSNKLRVYSPTMDLETNRLFRDVSGYYNICVSIDTTQGTAANRAKLYINGVQETSFATETYPSQNDDLPVNTNTLHKIGAGASTDYFSGIISHMHFSDGYALAPTVFGSTDATTGEWKINTSPTMTMGTNGFTILKDGNTITDQSSNSNNFTLSAGTLTKTEDCPSDVFATMNPLDKSASPAVLTFSNGNTTTAVDNSTPANGTGSKSGLAFNKGKYYCECKINSIGGSTRLGIIDVSQLTYPTNGNPSFFTKLYEYNANGNKGNNGSNVSYGATYTAGDIIGIAHDADNGSITFYKNGTTQGVAFSSLDTSITWCFYTYLYSLASVSWNFGNGYFGTTAVASAGTNASGIGIFEYDVPTGYTALSTKGLNS